LKKGLNRIYKVKEEVANTYEFSESEADNIVERIKEIVTETDVGGRIALDFEDIKLINPLLLSAVIDKLVEEGKKEGRGILRGRYIIAKDPNEAVLEQIRLFLRDKHKGVSLLVVYSDPYKPKDGPPYKTLNLPPFLQETWDILEKQPMRVTEMFAQLGQKGSTRERLRQLVKRGLAVREPEGDPITGDLYFKYKIFTFEDKPE